MVEDAGGNVWIGTWFNGLFRYNGAGFQHFLLGRERERDEVRRVLDRARSGASATLAIVGEPGIGKTALLDDAAEQAGGMRVLRARLYELELEKREAKVDADAASKTDIGWGHQIRSYVLQPYQMVKDLRTGHVSSSPADVLDGDLDPFMEASLAQRLSGRTVTVEDVE